MTMHSLNQTVFESLRPLCLLLGLSPNVAKGVGVLFGLRVNTGTPSLHSNPRNRQLPGAERRVRNEYARVLIAFYLESPLQFLFFWFDQYYIENPIR